VEEFHLLTSLVNGAEWSPSHMAAFHLRKSYTHLAWRLGGPHSQSGCGGREKMPSLNCSILKILTELLTGFKADTRVI
jgi:hypothetical protein